ncbi:chemotaxis protein CheY [Dehalococcoides mccartyi]|uniref:Chemotaxis protein CheY n=1 Tax=Dehalococcoides mccartyi TaxID=61435 RepID=A0A0V8M500_9CHLR|nr:response regulator transcription factor [Dehalococcoides mccartyi]KSV18851.1 chemotaxis protein CheY [Dehalococcoides mccartyi]
MNGQNSKANIIGSKSAKVVKIVLIDDHEIVRCGLANMLKDEPHILLVGDASNAEDGLSIIAKTNPDVVLLDIQLNNSGIDGFSLVKIIKTQTPDRVVIMLTGFDSELYLTEALRNKVDGFILKELPQTLLVCAIKMACYGISVWDTKILYRALANIQNPKEGDMEYLVSSKFGLELTDKEKAVFRLLAKGYSNKDIGSGLNYRPSTVKKYVYTCMKKLGVRNRTQLAILANDNSLK